MEYNIDVDKRRPTGEKVPGSACFLVLQYEVMLTPTPDQSPSSLAGGVRTRIGGTREESNAMAVINGTTLLY